MSEVSPSCNAALGPKRPLLLPCTTPCLAGTRVRAKTPQTLEFLVPNPAGGRSFFVMDAPALPQFCHLTVHDELLLEELPSPAQLSPAAIRQAARRVALTGAAGRDAAEAAAAAERQDQAMKRLAHMLLLARLLAAAKVNDIDLARFDPNQEAMRRELKAKLVQFGLRIGMSPDELLAAAEGLAPLAAEIGLGGSDLRGRHAERLAGLKTFIASLDRWALVEGETVSTLARRIVAEARQTCAQLEPWLGTAATLIADLCALLQRWRGDAAELRAELEAFDWLFDGWDEACSLWEAASRGTRALQRATLQHIERLLPPKPAEIQANGRVGPSELRWPQSRSVRPDEDWRTGVILSEWQARREGLRTGRLA